MSPGADEKPTSPLAAVRNLRRAELPFAGLMFLQFFLVITTFWVLKPLKKTLFIGFYDESAFTALGPAFSAAEAELLAKVLNMAVAMLAVVVFSWLSRALRRERLNVLLAGAFMAGFLAFGQVLGGTGAATDRPEWAVWAFYLFGDLFTTVMVAAFFAFLNDSVSTGEAKRLYGPVGLGGVLGGALGSMAVSVWIDALPLTGWLWICFGLGAAIIAVALGAGRASRALDGSEDAAGSGEADGPGESSAADGNPALAGARLVVRSRYLLALVAIVAIYELVSTILDYQFTATVAHYLDGAERDQHFATIYAITNAIAAAIQLFFTSFILSRFGVGPALLVMPLAVLGASGAFAALPLLWVGSALSPVDNALNYSLNQSARESLYVPRSAQEKYQAKAFIDMFVQRSAKAAAVGVSLGVGLFFDSFDGVRWLSAITLPLAAAWLLAARYLGRRFREIERAGGAPA